MNQTYTGKLEWQRRYAAAHYMHYQATLPGIIADGHYCLPKYPDIKTTNGITRFIIDYTAWHGALSERIGVEGRTIKQKDIKTANGGVIVGKSVRIKSSGKKGSADTSVTFRGYSIKIEIKNIFTKDRMRQPQEEYKQKVQQAGALHFIARDVESFIEWWDKVLTLPPVGIPNGLFD